MPAFVSKRVRDAWPTIRGFVYQVDMTLLRSLGLPADQILELERGEDVYVVSAVFENPDTEDAAIERSELDMLPTREEDPVPNGQTLESIVWLHLRDEPLRSPWRNQPPGSHGSLAQGQLASERRKKSPFHRFIYLEGYSYSQIRSTFTGVTLLELLLCSLRHRLDRRLGNPYRRLL
jgi:hypothetical protein